MTAYSIFARKADAELVAVPDRFSWFAALLFPLYALVHGLWLALVGWIAVLLVLVLLVVPVIGADAVLGLYLVFAALLGFEAATLRRLALRQRRFAYGGERIASSEEAAAVAWLEGPRGTR